MTSVQNTIYTSTIINIYTQMNHDIITPTEACNKLNDIATKDLDIDDLIQGIRIDCGINNQDDMVNNPDLYNGTLDVIPSDLLTNPKSTCLVKEEYSDNFVRPITKWDVIDFGNKVLRALNTYTRA